MAAAPTPAADDRSGADPAEGRPPARTTPTRAARKSAPAKKSGTKSGVKSGTKTGAKTGAKKAGAAKTGTRDAGSKSAGAAKTGSKKAGSKKAGAKKAGAKKAGAKKAGTEQAPSPAASPAPTSAGEVPVAPTGALPGESTRSTAAGRLAACASITEDLLNDLVLIGVGAGVPLDPVETDVTLPGMGEVRLQLALTVTGAEFDLRAEDGGRARVVVRAMGDVGVRTSDMEGDVTEGAATGGVPLPQVPVPVRVEALVDIFVELHEDLSVGVGLDLSAGELVSLSVDPDAPTPEGMADGAWAGLVQMAGMMFSMMGDGLFDTLGQHVGRIAADLGPEVGEMMSALGVAVGPGTVSVSSGLLTFHLPAHERVVGRAEPVPVAGKRVGIGLARSGVDHLARELLARAVGDLPLPFELEVDLGEQQVGAALRQTRLISERFPDLRTAVRTEVRPRLVGGRLELSVRAAWLELPPALPSVLNQLSRRLGGLASLAPLNFRFPATVQVPMVPGSDDTVPVVVDDLRVTADGVGVVLGLG